MVILIDQTPIFKWFMIRPVVENRHHKDMFQCEIELG